ncbi:MAG: DUF3450 family protein [Planctomycetota bacterium]|jgi:hypothetical protein
MTRAPIDARPGSPGRLRPFRLAPAAALALTAAVLLLAAGDGRASQDADGGVDGARAAIERMVETRRIISRERADWALGRELLEDRIAVVREEIASIRERIDRTQESISEADRTREELAGQADRLRESSEGLAEMVAGLESRTATLLERLPDPIRERVRPLSQRFPSDPAASELSLSARFQNVIGVLNELNKFHREISVTSEVREIAIGSTTQPIEVAAVYIGVSLGFYASSDGRFAGTGTATDGAWTWTERNEAAAEIQRAIAILQGEAVAEFLPLPVTID